MNVPNQIPRKAPQGVYETRLPGSTGAMLTTKEAADFLGLRDATLRGWRMAGVGPPYFTMGVTRHRGVRYDRADLEVFKSERRCVSSVLRTRRSDATFQKSA